MFGKKSVVKLKFILSTLIFVFVGVVSLSQFKVQPVSAFVPVTSPITSAMLQISGVVRYLDTAVWRFLPGSGAEVNAHNNKTGEDFMTTTDPNGNYTLSVTPGKYKLWADGSGFTSFKFVPKFNNLPVLFNFPNMDFFGLPKH